MPNDARTDLPEGIVTEPHTLIRPYADLMTDTGIGTQALFGQRFDCFSQNEERAQGALYSVVSGVERIDYIGSLPTSSLVEGTAAPTHIVTAVAATVFAAADIKSRLVGSLPRNSALVGEVDGMFLNCRYSGFIHLQHIREVGQKPDRPFKQMAFDMLGLPYVWGGTGGVGVDCSGLVQSALAAIGVDAPRDADQQEASLGRAVDFAARKAGDLLFWPGHVGIVIEGDRLLHANAHHMCVAVEPVLTAVQRIGEVRTTKRL